MEKSEGAKMYLVTKEIARAGLTFCCLQEVRYRNSGRKIICLDSGEKFEFLWCGKKKRRDAGVGLIIKVDKEIIVNEPEISDPRLMAINLKIYGFNIRLINAYSPTNIDGSIQQKDDFYRNLRKAACKKEKHEKIIIVGDFNAQTAIAYEQCFFGSNHNMVVDKECNDNGARLKDFCREKHLGMVQTFFDHQLEKRYTWYSNDGKTKKIIDYVLAENFVQQFITDCRVEPEFDFESDHRLITTEMHTPRTRQARKKPSKTTNMGTPYDIKSLVCERVHKSFIKEVVTLYKPCSVESTATQIYENISHTLNRAAENTLPKKTKSKTREIWKEDDELNRLILERNTLTNFSDEYKDVTKNIKKRVKKLRNDIIKQEADDITNFASKRELEELFRKFKEDTSTFKNKEKVNKCDPAKLKKYFEEHFNIDRNDPDPIELTEAPNFVQKLHDVSVDGIVTGPPSQDEIMKVIKKLKFGKSANDIPALFLKQVICCEDLMLEMTKMYELVWETNKIPTKWCHSRLIAIWKGAAKGKADDPNTYRGIQIGSTFCKIMIIVILDRLRTWYDRQILEQQQGFRSGRGTIEGIYILKRVQQISHQTKKPLYVLFIDLTAAFDHIERNWLFKIIKQRVPDSANLKLFELIQAIYSYTTTALNHNDDDIFEIINGVRQGGPESPILFNLYMDYVMRVFIKSCRDQDIKFFKHSFSIPSIASNQQNNKFNLGTYGDSVIDWIGYADDLALCFFDEKSLGYALNLLNKTFIRYHLDINIGKTKTMILNHDCSEEYPTSICSIDGKPIENVKVFRYLGSEIKYDEEYTGEAELNLRIDFAQGKFYQHGKKFMNHNISLNTRVRLLNSLVRSRLTYGCQIWTLTVRQKQRIGSVYLSMLRKMVRGGYKRNPNQWSFVYTNEDLLRLCNTEPINAFIHRMQRGYVAHLIRKEDSSISKRLLFNTEHIKRPGRYISLLSTVLQRETCVLQTFIKNAMDRKY